MKKYILFIVTLSLLFTACVGDRDEVFQESSAARMQQYLETTRQTLVSAEHGWAIDYYPERSQQGYGGFVYAAKFTDDGVQVASELAPDTTITSLYRLKSDNGPVLSFDSFNLLMHYFATPSQQRYEAYDGDFELVIDSVSSDFISLHGKRNKNQVYMHRLNVPAKEYIQRVNDFISRFPVVGGAATIDGRQDTVIFDASTRQATVILPDTTFQSAFVFYDEGLRLYKQAYVGDKKIGNFRFNDADLTLTNTYAGATDVVFRGIVSPALVQQAVGQYVGFSDAGGSRSFSVNRLDLYQVASSADWCHVSQQADQLTIAVDPNDTGDVRTATVVVSVGIAVAAISVSQADATDLPGDYYVAYYDADNREQYRDATISLSDDGQLQLSFAVSNTQLTFPLTLNTDRLALQMESGVVVGSVHNTYQDQTYYFAPIFMDALGTEWSNHERGYFAEVPLVQNPQFGTVGVFGGSLATTDIAQIFIGGYNSPTISADTYVAYLERMQSPILQRKYEESESRVTTFLRLAK